MSERASTPSFNPEDAAAIRQEGLRRDQEQIDIASQTPGYGAPVRQPETLTAEQRAGLVEVPDDLKSARSVNPETTSHHVITSEEVPKPGREVVDPNDANDFVDAEVPTRSELENDGQEV